MDFQYGRLRVNNALERIMKEIRRRTRPDGYSAMMLVEARLRHISTTKWGTRQYMNTCKLYEGGIKVKRREAPPSQPTCSSGALWSVGCFGYANSRLSSVITQNKCAQNLGHYHRMLVTLLADLAKNNLKNVKLLKS